MIARGVVRPPATLTARHPEATDPGYLGEDIPGQELGITSPPPCEVVLVLKVVLGVVVTTGVVVMTGVVVVMTAVVEEVVVTGPPIRLFATQELKELLRAAARLCVQVK